MVIKRNVQCAECKKYVDIYADPKLSLKGIKIKCECGSVAVCISDNKIISKWRVIHE